MNQSLVTVIQEARVEFTMRPFAVPLVLSSGTISQLTEATARVTVTVNGKTSRGAGSIYLSDLWAWPDPSYSHDQRDALMRELSQRIAALLPELSRENPGHPLALGLRLHHRVCDHELGVGNGASMSKLAGAVCLSPFDAAIHDAVGRAMGRGAFDLYDQDFQCPGADDLFEHGACRAVRQLIRPTPITHSPAWVIVGKQDDLDHDLKPWVDRRGYHHVKLKITGSNIDADIARTAEVFRAMRSYGARNVKLTVDSNEANPDAASVMAYLRGLEAQAPQAYAALQYLEQPTGRDIEKHAFDWRDVSQRKPVLLDEGLTDLDLLPIAKAQGWSGLAIKTCKGHSFALVAGAWAMENKMPIALQDLTNPGLSAIHAAMFAGYVPTINGVELNSPQFTPAANQAFLADWPGLFDVTDGRHALPPAATVGLGAC